MILVIVSALIALVLTLLSGVVYIDFLKKKMFTQYIREEGPKHHQLKKGTPTTGGVFLIISAIVACSIALFLYQVPKTTTALIVIISFLFFAFAGFKDDISKIQNKQNEGLTPKAKLFLQCLIALLPSLYVTLTGQTALMIGHYSIDLGFIYPFFAVFLITGTSNAVNLTDGLDGLASMNCAISFLCCAFVCLILQQIDLAIISSSIFGSCIGFLYFNKPKAQVFMGDTGSLALGGVLATICVMGKFELWLLFFGFIYMIETLSVMLQVLSFKLTGKRLFKMSPIHHHFELLGWSEKKIVVVFSLVTSLFSIMGVILFCMVLPQV